MTKGMTRIIHFSFIIIMLVGTFLTISCTTSKTTSSVTTSTPSTSVSSSSIATTSSTTKSVSTQSANWWDKFGVPQYGGSISIRVSSLGAIFDTYTNNFGGHYAWIESLWGPDWTANRNDWSFNSAYIPGKYMKGQLVESWEQLNPSSLTLHINKKAHWQNKAPMNGRAVTAHDLEYYYNRMLGMGNGYTVPIPMYAALRGLVESITVNDEYTITLKFTKPGIGTLWNFKQVGPSARVEAPEALEAAGGSYKNKDQAVGTGAFILKEFTTGASETCVKNTDYYGYDERYPQNKLPYVDEFRLVCIPDMATALAALRTGQLDIIETVDITQATSLAKTNPELKQAALPAGGPGVNLRVDLKPYDNIRVRKALQMAINRPEIAAGYYKGVVDGKPAGNVLPDYKGCNYPYSEWPQSLKDEYSYNPEKSKALLTEAGYPNGFKTKMLASTTEDLQLAQAIKAYFLDVGVDTTIEAMDQIALNSITSTRKHDALLFGGATTSNLQLTLVVHMFYSGDLMLNKSAIKSPEYDALYDKFSNAATEDEATNIIKSMDKLGLEQHWQIQVCPIVSYNIYQPYLMGYSGEYINGFQLGTLFYYNRMWIDQNLKKTMR